VLRRTVSLDPADTLALLDTSREGLSIEEAAAWPRRNGPKTLPVPHGPGLPRLFVDQLVHFFALMLWLAAGLAFIGRLSQLGIAIVL
jgi:Cation transporter/ATPase, N-terminus